MTKPKDDAAPAKASNPTASATPAATTRRCGLVMPISAMDGIPASHWAEVKSIIADAVLPDWDLVMVSDGDDAVIHRRIVERLYSDELVIVDLSARNPNVMLELGMRLAFDKRTVVVKDDQTPYPFDMAPNEYVEYPRDLRFQKIVDFKKRLVERVAATMSPGHTTYLKSFGTIKVAKIETEVVSLDQVVLEKLERVETLLERATAREILTLDQNFTSGPFAGLPVRIGLSHLGTSAIEKNSLKRLSHLMAEFGVPKILVEKAIPRFLKEYGSEFSALDIEMWCAREGFAPGAS